MSHTVTLTDRQLEIIYDLLEERLEDIEEDIRHYEAHPEELTQATEPDEEPLRIDDYESYRDEVQTLIDMLPAPEDELD
ncbi:MAG: hypothetical protein VKS61_03225 [Candidatus Sericytochromatia bacterium]|nr:hypothetical protein [Candidatus Sericytochromatia bacterium]